MTNLGIEILFWTILISYLGLRFSQTWNAVSYTHLTLPTILRV